ncbi:hypothetical protein [Zhongshania sp.]|uniref:hypothetical protein n=1 Tax=Zhongshania sp. TaxID=1971902 RepID=UPI0035638AB2
MAASRDIEWKIVNGAVPTVLGQAQSLSKYLSGAFLEEGWFAAPEFRRHHFNSMRWRPLEDERARFLNMKIFSGVKRLYSMSY